MPTNIAPPAPSANRSTPDMLDILRGRVKPSAQIKREAEAAAEKWRKHFLADPGADLDRVPSDQITPELLAIVDKSGRTVLHCAAAKGRLDQVPKELLTQKALAMADKSGWTVLHSAAYSGLGQVPKGLLTAKALAMADKDGLTVLHEASQFGHLDQVPKELLTPKALAMADKDGDTVLHCAARGGHLDQVPRELLTQKAMAMADEEGSTVLHKACLNDHLSQVPLASIDATITAAWAAGQWEKHPLNNLGPEAKAALERRFELLKEQQALGRAPVEAPEVSPFIPVARPDVSVAVE